MKPGTNSRFESPDHQFWAMGCTIEFWLDLDFDKEDPNQNPYALTKAAEALFHRYESVFSRFLPQSELSQINQRAGQIQTVSPLIGDAVQKALHACKITAGLFDCTLTNALHAAGYDQSFEPGRLAPSFQPEKWQLDLLTGRWAEIRFDPMDGRLFLPAGIQLDFGGIVKGITAQRAVKQLSDLGPCLVSAGGDVMAGSPPNGYPGWPVEVISPSHVNGIKPYTVWLRDAALVTSGIDYRRWDTADGLQHHIIDPRSGKPAETDLLSVSLLAGNIDMAEAWATAALVMGYGPAAALFEEHQVAASFVTQAGELHLTSAMLPHVKTDLPR